MVGPKFMYTAVLHNRESIHRSMVYLDVQQVVNSGEYLDRGSNVMEADRDRLKSQAEGNEKSLTENCTNVLCKEETSAAEGDEVAAVKNRAGNSSDKERTADVHVDKAGENVTARDETESDQSDDADDDEDDEIQENEIQETAVVQQVEVLVIYRFNV